MDEATIAQTILTAAIFAIFLGYFLWGLRTGQFKNVEEAKYSMFPDSEKRLGETPDAGKGVEKKT